MLVKNGQSRRKSSSASRASASTTAPPGWPNTLASTSWPAPQYRATGSNQIFNYGMDPDRLPEGEIDFSRQDLKRWKDVWSAGQGVGSVDRICPIAEVVDQLEREYRAACARG